MSDHIHTFRHCECGAVKPHRRVHNAKLTSEAVADIRASTETLAALGRKYGVSHVTIYYVRSGRNWRDA